jgi:GNAT superfamily N-acetyltransferase
MNIRIEAATSTQQWTVMSAIRTQVFTAEYRLSFRPYPGPGWTGVWHFLARDNEDGVGTLSVVDTTGDHSLHERYRLSFGKNERIARYAQLAILRPYRKRGILQMLIEAAQNTIIRPNGFAVGWLLYPAARATSSVLTERLGFTAEAPVLMTELGRCRVLIRRESCSQPVDCSQELFPVIETCPI